MADNRDAIVAAVVARMETIRKSAGYLTDAGLSVTRWRSVPPPATECPTIEVRDPSRKPAGTYTRGAQDYLLTVDCIGAAAAGQETDKALTDLITDIVKAGLEGDVTWGGLAINTTLESDEKGVLQNDVKVGVAPVRFSIRYRKTG